MAKLSLTRKWYVARITAASGWFIAWIENGHELNTSLEILGVTIIAEGLTSALARNKPRVKTDHEGDQPR